MKALNEQQLAAVEATGEVFVSAGAGTGKTAVLVERFVRSVCDHGLDVDSILVITYTRRAAGELRTRIRAELARARPPRSRARARRRLDLDHPRLLPPAAEVVPVRRRARPALPRARRRPGGRAPQRGLPEGARRVLRRRRARAAAPARDVRRRRAAADADRRLRDAPVCRSRARARRGRTARPRRARGGAARGGARPRTTRRRRSSCELLERDSRPDRLLDLSGFRIRGDHAGAYEEARHAVEQAALDEAASRDRDLLQELLERFADAYAADEGTGVGTRLRGPAAQRARPASRPRRRSASARRCASARSWSTSSRTRTGCSASSSTCLREAGAELFFVGDEFQSIYGFRHADVRVFRERRAKTAQLLPLTLNYRSRPEVLAAVNELFGSHFGDEFQPLAAAAEFPDPVFGHPVELLVTDKAAYHDTGVHWRRAEARSIARRVRELVDSGAATAGEIVVLFAAGTDAEVYEQELRRAGLPTYRATGKGYFGQQQVVDLLAYLRLLQNRYDDRALLTVLASPFVGVSNDALALVRRAATRRPLYAGIERSLPDGLSHDDERLLRAFRQRYDRLSAALPRLSLERLCERVVSEHDYDLAVLAQWDGRRRYANMRKLARLARSYEELRGPDVEGFVRFVGEQEALGAHAARGGRRGGGSGRGAPAHDPRCQGPRVRGRHRRRRRARQGSAVAGRDPRALRRALRLPRRRPGDHEAPRGVRLRGGEEGAEGGGRGREAAPLLRRDDACARAADRLRRDRPREGGGRVDADRLGARASAGRRRARRQPASRTAAFSRSKVTRKNEASAIVSQARRNRMPFLATKTSPMLTTRKSKQHQAAPSDLAPRNPRRYSVP